MLLELAITLTVIAVLLELAIVGQFTFLADVFRRRSFAGLLFSIALSYALGSLFEATSSSCCPPQRRRW